MILPDGGKDLPGKGRINIFKGGEPAFKGGDRQSLPVQLIPEGGQLRITVMSGIKEGVKPFRSLDKRRKNLNDLSQDRALPQFFHRSSSSELSFQEWGR